MNPSGVGEARQPEKVFTTCGGRGAHPAPRLGSAACGGETRERLHVLYLHQHFATAEGSSGVRSYEFAQSLARSGHRVTLIWGRYDRSGLPPRSKGFLECRELVGWARPSERLLGFLREITERGAFRSMDIDVFETADGRLLVNELQTVFGSIRGANLDRGAENRGRWRLDEASDDWRFEQGDFYRNARANERVRDVVERGLRRRPGADRRRPAGPEEIRQAP